MKTVDQLPRLNLPPCTLRIEKRGGETCVWDGGRRKWLVLTPEEWVRRHVLAMLCGHGVTPASIAQEHPAMVNGQTQRADIVVYGPNGRPAMLVECKAPGVRIDQKTLDQAFRYNTVLEAPHVMLTNGIDHYIYKVSKEGGYTPLREFPPIV